MCQKRVSHVHIKDVGENPHLELQTELTDKQDMKNKGKEEEQTHKSCKMWWAFKQSHMSIIIAFLLYATYSAHSVIEEAFFMAENNSEQLFVNAGIDARIGVLATSEQN